MAWISTNEDPRFKELQAGEVFVFNSGKPEEDDLRGFWIRTKGSLVDTVNAVRLRDGGKHQFKESDRVEKAIGFRMMA